MFWHCNEDFRCKKSVFTPSLRSKTAEEGLILLWRTNKAETERIQLKMNEKIPVKIFSAFKLETQVDAFRSMAACEIDKNASYDGLYGSYWVSISEKKGKSQSKTNNIRARYAYLWRAGRGKTRTQLKRLNLRQESCFQLIAIPEPAECGGDLDLK